MLRRLGTLTIFWLLSLAAVGPARALVDCPLGNTGDTATSGSLTCSRDFQITLSASTPGEMVYSPGSPPPIVTPPLFLGMELNGGRTACLASPAAAYYIRFRMYVDAPAYEARNQVCPDGVDELACDAPGADRSSIPIDDPNYPQDGVLRVELLEAKFPPEACGDVPGEGFLHSFEFLSICGQTLNASGETGLLDPNTSPCIGAYEDRGWGVFGEHVFANPSGLGDTASVEEKALRVTNDDPNGVPLEYDEAQQGALKILFPIAGVPSVSGVPFGDPGTPSTWQTYSFEVTTGAVKGTSPGPGAVGSFPLGEFPIGAVPVDPNDLIDPNYIGTPLNPTTGAIELRGAAITPNTGGGSPASPWFNSISILSLNGTVSNLTGAGTLAQALESLTPDLDGDGLPNAIDPDDDEDGIKDDDDATSAPGSIPADPICSISSNDDPDECLGGDYELSYDSASATCADPGGVTPPRRTYQRDWDSDDDGLPDGQCSYTGAPGLPSCNDLSASIAIPSNLECSPSDPSSEACGEDLSRDGCENTDASSLGNPETSPLLADTDADGLDDPDEVERLVDSALDSDSLINGRDSDSDGDGLADTEGNTDSPEDADAATNMLDHDSDGDGLCDSSGVDAAPSCPTGAELLPLIDVDTDTKVNMVDRDSDNGGAEDGFEVANGFNMLSATDDASDPDSDGLTVAQEQTAGTDPNDSDTDNDGLLDGFEVDNGFNPLVGGEESVDTDTD
ncbi:MAG: hypothetical protein GY725_06860, partial [bacterium]|nr:hypothetical protein [bacterium]